MARKEYPSDKQAKIGRACGYRKKIRTQQPEVLATPVGFAEGVLGYPRLYKWQCDVLQPFMCASGAEAKLTQVAVMSPNEGGRSSLLGVRYSDVVAGDAHPGQSWDNDGGSEAVKRTDSPGTGTEQAEDARVALGVQSPYYRLMTPTVGG